MPAFLWEKLLNFESDSLFNFLSLHDCNDDGGFNA